ncbi:atp synthase subunit 9 protein [Lasallia pustulata]|uniref:ATP synthase subunit 9, mitochondrial n=1 Tax=Lasallia pustulata TaxID=136370 RepID=A0A1W5D4P6_9LECA|nr:atp synthase subunit 9 protein [Lasallia pustulata]
MASTTRLLAPKVASLMGSTSIKAARPALRVNLNVQSKSSARGFSGVSTGLRSNTASPFRNLKRQQASHILSATTRSMLSRQTARPYSSEVASAMVVMSQNLGMGLAAIGLGGAGIGIGLVFAALLKAVARNPSLRGQLFTYSILGFAFVEAMGLFTLMVAMMCKYV